MCPSGHTPPTSPAVAGPAASVKRRQLRVTHRARGVGCLRVNLCRLSVRNFTRATLDTHESHGLPHEPRSSFTSPTDSHTSHARHSRVPRTPTRATLDNHESHGLPHGHARHSRVPRTPTRATLVIHESHGLPHKPRSAFTSPTDSHTSHARQSRVPRTPTRALPRFILCCKFMKRIHRRWNPDTRDRSFHRPRIPSARSSPLLFPRPRVRVFRLQSYNVGLPARAALTASTARDACSSLPARPTASARAALTVRIACDVCSSLPVRPTALSSHSSHGSHSS